MAPVERATTKRIAKNLIECTESLSRKRRAFSIVTQLDDFKMKRFREGPAPGSDFELDLFQRALGWNDMVVEAQFRRIHSER
jgi:hypothetical protein